VCDDQEREGYVGSSAEPEKKITARFGKGKGKKRESGKSV